MPDKKGRFSGQEKMFIEAMVRTGDQQEAARAAGYKSSGAAHLVMARADVRSDIQSRIEAKLTARGEVAIKNLDHFLNDAGVSDRYKWEATKYVLNGIRERRPDEMEAEQSSMSSEQIARLITALQNKQADMARPVIEHEKPETEGVFG